MKCKLVCFDVDGTLVDNIIYSWELFHNYFNVDKKRRYIAKKRFYNNEISYLEWAWHDINMWIEKGVKKDDFFQALKQNGVKLMNGAIETLTKLKSMGIKLAIISGSLDIILEYLLPHYKKIFEHIFLTKLSFDDKGNLVGAKPTAFDMDKKVDALKLICKLDNIELQNTVFVGDHHNDVKIAQVAGLSIAFDAKDKALREVCDIVIYKKDLREVLKFVKD